MAAVMAHDRAAALAGVERKARTRTCPICVEVA
jgi:hypothetical protein